MVSLVSHLSVVSAFLITCSGTDQRLKEISQRFQCFTM